MFKQFTPFWEFLSGPIHAGIYVPGQLDNTFGPKLKFVKALPEGHANRSPREGFQFFGQVGLAPASEALYTKVLMPA